jgi:hypothetical protein
MGMTGELEIVFFFFARTKTKVQGTMAVVVVLSSEL